MPSRSARRHSPRSLLLLAALAVALAACAPTFDRSVLVSGAPAGTTGVGDPLASDTTGDGSTGSDDGGVTGEVDPDAEPGDATSGDATTGDATTGDGTTGGSTSGSTGGATSGAATSGSTTGSSSGTTGSTTSGSTGSTSGGTTGATTGPAAVDPGNQQGVTDTEIKIGYLVPLTGAAPVPTSWDEGANFYWDELNKAGGINGRKVKLIIEDTESSTTTAVNKARKLATQDRVFTIISLDRLEVQDAIAQFLEQAQMPHIMIQSPANPNPNWKNTFTISIDHIRQGKAIAQFMSGELGAAGGAKKVAFVREQTNALKPGTDAFEQQAAALGLDVVARETINPQQQEFGQTVIKLQQSGAEIVWLYMAPTPAATIVNQSFTNAYTPTWFANSISWGFELMHQAGGPGMDGAYAFSPWVSLTSPKAAQFKQKWQSVKGTNPDDFALVGWGIGEVATSGLQNAGKSLGHNTFRTALRGLKTPARVWGPVDFTGGGSVGSNSVAVYKAVGGAWQTQGDFRRY